MKQIAVIGTGISGLTAAHLLSQKHQVTVFEKNDYIGGHTATVDVNVEGDDYVIDTGFIVFNNQTYPNFIKLLSKLGVEKQPTEMSFSVHNQHSGLEYNGHTLATLFAQKRNILNPKFWRLIYDIVRFNRLCKTLHEEGRASEKDNQTLGDFLNQHGFNDFFSQHYILPMAAAIWSASLNEIRDIQFLFFLNFFHNHGLLNVTNRPQWYVIKGGSRSYIPPLTANFAEHIVLNAQIEKITRENNKVQLHFAEQGAGMAASVQEFDEVVLACHSNQALALLADATSDEQRVLEDMPYSKNSVILHTDITLLPKRKQAWASWNYQLEPHSNKPACVTYNMNILQGLHSEHTFCVSLNQADNINKAKILRTFEYDHPTFSLTSLAAQQQREKICGQNHTHFAGAYWYNGFHEDGVRSGVDVANRFDCRL